LSVEVRDLALGDVDAVAAYCALRAAVDPDGAETPAAMAWEDATYPGQVWRFLALRGGKPTGAATTGRMHVFGPEHPRFYLGIWVPRAARRRGVGSALYRASSERARAAGKTGFQCWASEGHPDGVSFLRARGFTEVDRGKGVALGLRALRRSPAALMPAAPNGFDIVTLLDRPDLVAGVHRCAVEAFPSIPSSTPMEPGTLEEFEAREIRRETVPLDAFFVAVEAATGEVAGYASLIYVPGSTTVAHHDMTAVRPAFRGRGLATALKRCTIAWAIRGGLDELRAHNDEANAAMRSVNARLGYRPLPDEIGFVGPLAPEASVSPGRPG
jgi:GNAT superfamily N-acetyltransferase